MRHSPPISHFFLDHLESVSQLAIQILLKGTFCEFFRFFYSLVSEIDFLKSVYREREKVTKKHSNGKVMFFYELLSGIYIVTNVNYGSLGITEMTGLARTLITDGWLTWQWSLFMTVFCKTLKHTDVYERYWLRIESELRMIQMINKSMVRKSIRIMFNKHCGDFIKPPDFLFRNNWCQKWFDNLRVGSTARLLFARINVSVPWQ